MVFFHSFCFNRSLKTIDYTIVHLSVLGLPLNSPKMFNNSISEHSYEIKIVLWSNTMSTCGMLNSLSPVFSFRRVISVCPSHTRFNVDDKMFWQVAHHSGVYLAVTHSQSKSRSLQISRHLSWPLSIVVIVSGSVDSPIYSKVKPCLCDYVVSCTCWLTAWSLWSQPVSRHGFSKLG